MSLFDKITQGFSQVSELFSKPDANGGLSETNKAAPTSFWTNLFGKSSIPNFNQDAGLKFTAQNIRLSNDDIKANYVREAARLNPSAPLGQVKVYQEGIQNDGTYVANVLPGDVGAARWSKEINPADVAKVGLRKAALGLGIANNADEAQKIVDHLSVTGLHKGKTDINKTDLGFGAWMKQQTIGRGQLQIHSGAEEIALLRASARELKIGNPDVAVIAPSAATKQADAGTLAAGTLALPKIAEQLPKAAILVGEAVPPLLAIGSGVLLGGALINQHYEVSKSNWEDQQKAKVMPLPIPMPDLHMEDTGDAPPARPTDTAERPAQPKAQPIPDANTQPGQEITVRPNTQPQAKPVTINDLPQPETLDVPKRTPPIPQQEPPTNPKDILPPIIGAATAVAGKAAADALKTENQSVALPPGLDKIRASLKDPLAQKSFDQRYAQIQSDAQLDDTKKLAKFHGYLESAKQLGNGDMEQGLIKDLQEYTFRRGLNLPYGTENRITFAEFGKQVREGFNKAGVKDAQAYIQGSAITGVKYTTGKIFDVGRKSDWDMAVASPTLFAKAKSIGVEIRGKGTRTEPLTDEQIAELGLWNLKEQLDKTAGRDVGIMIFNTPQDAKNRNPNGIYVP